MADPHKVLGEWRACLLKGADCDSWGLLVEAVEEYQNVFRIWYGHSDCKMRRKRQPPLDVAKDHVSQNKDQQDKFEVQEMEEKGRGVFTTVNISSGEFLVHYAGELISGAEGEERQLNSKSVYRYFFAWKGSSFRLSRQIMTEVSKSSTFSNKQKQTLNKIAACLELRSQTLQKPQEREGISLDELRKLESSFTALQSNASCEFPVDFSVNPILAQRLNIQRGNFEIDVEGDEIDGSSKGDDSDDEDSRQAAADSRLKSLKVSHASIKPAGTLLPRIPPEPGTTNITIRIEKIGLKDSYLYLDPFLVVSVKDKTGIDVTRSQDTPVSTERDDPYILFGVEVEVQKPLEKLPPGSAIFFEFKHYKLKKRSISTKCYAFLEMDEIRPGPLVIELYKKPTDFRRKKLSLLTNKTLYLHLNLKLHKW